MIGVRPPTVSRNAVKVGGGSPESLIRISRSRRSLTRKAAQWRRSGDRASHHGKQWLLRRRSTGCRIRCRSRRRSPPPPRVACFRSLRSRVMQAAMGDRTLNEPGGSVDWRQASISKTASTSASALRGRCDTPTVVRAWRPCSPNSSATKLDAPFMAWARDRSSNATLKNPPSRTTCFIRSRSPSAACAWAITLIAHSGPPRSRLRLRNRPRVCLDGARRAYHLARTAAGRRRTATIPPHGRDIVCDRRRGLWQNDAHFFQALGGLAHGGRHSSAWPRSRTGRSGRRTAFAYVAFPVKATCFFPGACFAFYALRFGPKRGCAGGFPTGRRAMG